MARTRHAEAIFTVDQKTGLTRKEERLTEVDDPFAATDEDLRERDRLWREREVARIAPEVADRAQLEIVAQSGTPREQLLARAALKLPAPEIRDLAKAREQGETWNPDLPPWRARTRNP